MPSQGPSLPGTAASVFSDPFVGTVVWANFDNIKTHNDATEASADMGAGAVPTDIYARLVLSATLVGNDKSTNTDLDSVTTDRVYGGPSDLWGRAWTRADINDATFGFDFCVYNSFSLAYSEHLRATNFGFTIPVGGTIVGIQVDVGQRHAGFGFASVDHVRITVTYQIAAGDDEVAIACQTVEGIRGRRRQASIPY